MGIQEAIQSVFFEDVPTFQVCAQHGGPCSLQSPIRADLSLKLQLQMMQDLVLGY